MFFLARDKHAASGVMFLVFLFRPFFVFSSSKKATNTTQNKQVLCKRRIGLYAKSLKHKTNKTNDNKLIPTSQRDTGQKQKHTPSQDRISTAEGRDRER